MSVVLDWLAREGQLLLAWWLWMTLAGIAALPICIRLFSALPDRGYTLARALGMLLTTWLFWLLGSIGFLDNSSGSVAFAWMLLLALGYLVYTRLGAAFDWQGWWANNRSTIITAELLFALLFLVWALYRAAQNDLTGTEKPMELAFLSAAQRSPSFPPQDPWMSGFAISYYYMGYVMSAALSMLSGNSSSVGFNLTAAALFALAGIAAFGIACNMVRARAAMHAPLGARLPAILAGLLAATMLVGMGNFQLVFNELPYANGTATPEYLASWETQKLSPADLESYQQVPGAGLSLDSSSWRLWWWFGASRVPTDIDLDGRFTGTQPIGEFPAFSFILGDIHPHVLALPFVMLVMGIMLQIALQAHAPPGWQVLLAGIAVGGLAFLNAWDGPVFLVGLAGAEGLRRLLRNEEQRLRLGDWLSVLQFGALVAVVAGLAYLPYFIGFRSQAGGILPNLLHPAQIQHLFLMFGPLFIMLGCYLLVESWRAWRQRHLNLRAGLTLAACLLVVALLLMTVLAALLASLHPGQPIIGNLPPPVDGWGELAQQIAQRRWQYAPATLLLLAGIALCCARLFPAQSKPAHIGEVAPSLRSYTPATGSALLFIGMGLCLVFFCEFFYLKDNFFVRINTVFKLYYQAWALWSVAAAYGLYSIFADGARSRPQAHVLLRLVMGLLCIGSLLAGLLYTVLALNHRAIVETGRQSAAQWRRYEPAATWEGNFRRHVVQGQRVVPGTVLFSRSGGEDEAVRALDAGIVEVVGGGIVLHELLTLDGAVTLLHEDDRRAIDCLRDAVGDGEAAVAEAVGDAYNVNYGRVGTVTGIPVLLGWENHQRQWRGASYSEVAGNRASDLQTLFSSYDYAEAEAIIRRYNLTQIFFGTTERQRYGSLGEEKFLEHLPILCAAGNTRVYATGL